MLQTEIQKNFSHMNDMQKQAVFCTEGPLLILAGAGSGKTTVLVNRIAYILQCELCKPWQILAITFTNKAAGELKERICAAVPEGGADIWAATFHSTCARILRRYGDRIGYTSHFTVYGTDDQKKLVKDILKQLNIAEKTLPVKSILSEISRAKDKMLTPEEMRKEAEFDSRKAQIAKVYEIYQTKLKTSDAMDFDDMLCNTVKLFETAPDILDYYRNQFKYIMVDEYQDTNKVQYKFVSLLASKYGNICVVGDDDQSIYKFRGATIENILNFENQYRNTKVIRLEQNYRCTQTILDAANAVIEHNTQRKGKTLWTQNPKGNQVKVYRALSEQDEARFIADTILDDVAKGQKFSDHAILYRMNAQSNTLENALIRSGIAYKIVGGQRFYDRKEIKDIIAYLSVVNNRADSIRLKRIINEPKRGIGDATVDKAEEISAMLGIPLFEVLAHADEYQPLAKKCRPLMEFAQMIERLSEIAENGSLEELFDTLIEETGYLIHLRAMGDEGINRIENVNELKSNIIKYVEEMEKLPQLSINPENPDEQPEILMPTLAGFLEEVTLYTDIDGYDENADRVIMMTMHSAKGLEFDNVFFCGAEEGIFPGMQAIYNPDQIEEERRLAYVCITRAKKQLYITNAAQRMIFGQTVRNRVSRFVTEIPAGCCDVEDKTIRNASQAELKKASTVKKTRALNDIGVGGMAAARKTTSYSSDAPSGAAAVTLKAGDRVKHNTFGEGTLVKMTPMGGDCLLEVLFDTVGTKKIMYKFSKLTKIS